MKTLNTTVVGLGRIGWRFHTPQVAAHPGLNLTAVVDPVRDRREEAASQFGAAPYATLEQLLEAQSPDLVVIASPTQFHVDQAILAFDHGCDVFCDKPLAPTLDEADRMIERMRATGKKLMAYQPHRAVAELVALQDILSKGIIGQVYMIKRSNSNFVRRNDWQAFRRNHGGMLSNYGSHYVDQLLYLSGSKAKRVSCSLRTVASLGDADDVVKATIETESGVILDVDINMAAAQPLPPWHVLGKYGSVTWDAGQRAWRVRWFDPALAPVPTLDEGLAAPDRRYPRDTLPWQDEVVPIEGYEAVDYYAKCYAFYALGEPPFVPIAETRELVRVLDQCRRVAETQ